MPVNFGFRTLSSRDRLWVVLALAFGAATVAANLGLMSTSAYLIARAAQHPETVLLLWVPVVGVRFFGIFRGVFRYAERYFSHDVTFRLLKEIRVHVYRLVEPLLPEGGDRLRNGDLLARLVADVDTLQNEFLGLRAPVAIAAAGLVLAGALAAWMHPWLAAVLVGCLLAAGFALPWMADRLARRGAARRVTLRAELSQHLVETMNGLTDVLAFGAEDRAAARLDGLQRDWRRLEVGLHRASGLTAAATAAFTHLTVAAVAAVGVFLVQAGRLPGILLPVAALLAMAAFEAVGRLPEAFETRGAIEEARRRLADLEGRHPGVEVAPVTEPVPERPRIVVRHVRFRYRPGDPWVLRDVSLTLAPGRHLALVGPSGAGKSSVVAVLARLHEFQFGSITLSAGDLPRVDIRRFDPEAVRARMAVVEQFPHVFDATLRQNLLVARPGATDAELRRALAIAGLETLVGGLPDGLDTPVGERGLALSGGERKRLAIARAVLKDAPILLLDEPTEGLDPALARRVMRSVLAWARERAVLWITHSVDDLDLVDDVLVMDGGRIVQRGPAARLAATPGPFRALLRYRPVCG